MDGVEERNADHVTNHAQYVEINEIHSYELKRDDVKFERLVGSGNFGEVFKATIDNNTVAVKSLKGKIYVTYASLLFTLHVLFGLFGVPISLRTRNGKYSLSVFGSLNNLVIITCWKTRSLFTFSGSLCSVTYQTSSV